MHHTGDFSPLHSVNMNTYLIAAAEEIGVDIVRCQQSTHSAQAVCNVDLTIICVSGKILQVEGEKR